MQRKQIVIGACFLVVLILFVFVSYSQFISKETAPEIPQSELKKATIVASCAPWDGEAIHISTEKDGKRLGISLFAKGLDQFRAGKNVNITKSGDSITGIGVANLCDMTASPKCEVYEAGRVKIRNFGRYSEDGKLNLEILLDEEKIPIEATWDRSKQPRCG